MRADKQTKRTLRSTYCTIYVTNFISQVYYGECGFGESAQWTQLQGSRSCFSYVPLVWDKKNNKNHNDPYISKHTDICLSDSRGIKSFFQWWQYAVPKDQQRILNWMWGGNLHSVLPLLWSRLTFLCCCSCPGTEKEASVLRSSFPLALCSYSKVRFSCGASCKFVPWTSHTRRVYLTHYLNGDIQ